MSVDKVVLDKNSINVLDHTIKMDDESHVLLKFYDKKWYKVISAIDVLTNQVNKEELAGKFIMIGTSAVGLHDRYMISNGEIIPGVYAHATLVDNILNDDLIYQPKFVKNIAFALSLVLSFLLVYFFYKEYYTLLGILFIIFVCIAFIIASVFISQGMYISVGYFLVPFVLHFFLINIVFLFLHYKEKQLFYKNLSKAHSSAIDSMALVVESRDTETGAHIKRTKEYIMCLSEYLYSNGIYKDLLTSEYRELLYKANPLHDIGKVGIPDNILKKPGKLTEDEYTIMKTHSTIGKDIIKNAMKENGDNYFLKIAYNIAYYHHEKWDGNGYPKGLKGYEIPLEARIMALADVYDALISRRYYKEAFAYEDSEKIIIDGSASHFDPILVGAFIELKYKFREIAERIKE